MVSVSQGVSNFNAFDLATLSAVATEPIEANEARFTVGAMDHEALAYMHAHGIVPISYSSLSGGTDHPAVAAVAAAHKITPEQVVYAYVSQHNITVVNISPTSHGFTVRSIDQHLTNNDTNHNNQSIVNPVQPFKMAGQPVLRLCVQSVACILILRSIACGAALHMESGPH